MVTSSVGCKVLSILLLCASPLVAQDSAWAIRDNDQIQRVLVDQFTPMGTGAVVGIIEPAGQRIVTWGRSGTDRPLDEHTIFMIASLTKVFTSLLLADMAVRGEVALDDPVQQYLPPTVRMPQRGRRITLVDLSKHWSGLPSMPTTFPLDGTPNPYSALTEPQFYAFLSAYALPREPGTAGYSNVGVALLGKVLARRNGKDYPTLLQERVLAPLGLTSTAIALSGDQQKRFAPGHDRYGDRVETWDLLTMPASGGLRSSAHDLLQFLAHNIRHDSPLEAAMQLQRTPGRTLGWGRSMLGGEAVYGHEGGKEGYQSAMIFNPERGTGVVILLNGRGPTPMSIARHLLYRTATLPPPLPRPAKPKVIRLEPAQLDRFAGTWQSDSITIRIARREDHLLFYPLGGGISVLWPVGSNKFVSRVSDEEIEFPDANHLYYSSSVVRWVGSRSP